MKYLATIFFGLVFLSELHAQQELSLQLQRNLLQSNLVNPANQLSKPGVAIAIPSLYFNYSNSGFAYNDIIRQSDDGSGAIVDAEGAIDQLNEKNHLFINYNINYITAAYRRNKTQYGFYLTDRINASIHYPKQLLELLWYGNEPYLGDTMNVGPGIQAQKYREWGFTYGYEKERWTFGGRLKVLKGLANINTARNDFKIHTNEEDYSISIQSDYLLRTSNVEGFQDFISPFSESNNWGGGMDFGAVFNKNKRWSFSASVLDIGFINWRDSPTHYSTSGSFFFDGIDAFSFVNGDSLAVSDHLDSLSSLFDVESFEKSYTTQLSPSFYLSTSFRLAKKQYLSLQTFGEYIDGTLIPAFTAGYDTEMSFFSNELKLNLGGYWSYRNNSFYNLGLGVHFRYKFLEVFLVGDNVLSFLFPQKIVPLNRLSPVFKESSTRTMTVPGNLRNYNFRAGINIVINSKKSK